ncbi:MAG: SIS domain-containing protein [Rhizobiales bacterium]|nr:SIS domain-containing protein [Hyphomicrobiales bacterium]
MSENNEEALSGLYPFLHDKIQDPGQMNEALLKSVQLKADDHANVLEEFFKTHDQDVVDAAKTIADVYRNDGRLLTMGNGGSSCDAAHVAVEFQHPITAGRPALTAINLTSDITMMTAVGNDIGFAHVYTRQVISQGRKGDCLIGLSTSGNSDNLVNAFEKAQEMGIKTIGFAGMSGGAMKEIGLDHCLTINSQSIHRIQECHLIIYHILWDLVHTLLADDRGGLSTA